ELALELRRRVKEQQAFIGEAEFGKTDLSYSFSEQPERIVACAETVRHTMGEGQDAADVESNGGRSTSFPAPDPEEIETSKSATARQYEAGDVIDDRFEVLELLGHGGFSHVYRVIDRVEDQERAFKLFDNAAGYDAVRREIGALREVDHPNVVDVIWAGRTDAGDWYLITEFIHGESLEDFANGKKHLRDREAVDVALDVLDALIAIHPNAERLAELADKQNGGGLSEDEFNEFQELKARGLVHRDVKPQNVMLTRQGARLLDFNIASRAGDAVVTVSGTPPYQAPDADLTRWDVSTDLFAVGAMLYELLCNGEHPYEGGQPMAGEKVRDPRLLRSDLRAELADFLIKACAALREQRFSSAHEMKAALAGIRSGL
ncbi:hypothetical protein LCGC14_2609770, partial [marine sediment metagenome]